MADWWEGFQPAPSGQPQAAGRSSFLTPQSSGSGMFAGLPAEALIIAGLSGPQEGMKFLSPFMTQAPIEVMGPDGRPQLVSPWQARGFATPGTTLGFMREGREAQGQQFNQGMDIKKFDLEKDKALFDQRMRTGQFALDSANRAVTFDAQGRPITNPAAVDAARAQGDVSNPPIPVQVPGQPGRQVLVPRSQAVGQEPPREMSQGDRDAIRVADETAAASQQARAALHRALVLSGQAFQGPTSGAGVAAGRAWSSVGGDAPQTAATTEFNSIMTEQALTQLKAIFGGNPTEGERKILLEMQAASSMSRQERDALIKRAIAATENRERFNRETAAGIRAGTYYQPGGGPAAPSQVIPPSGRPDIPAPAVDHLRANPGLRDAFDQKYGKGAADFFLKTR